MSTHIEWTDETWNPVTGCTRVSEGCQNCYIERTPPMRISGRRFDGQQIGATTGVQLHPDRLAVPLRWRKPRKVFVCSMADLFHEDVPDEHIAKVFGVMAHADQHTYQVLTKRPARMRSLLGSDAFRELVFKSVSVDVGDVMGERWPLPNVWVGTSVESQKWADIRIPQLLDTPAAVRWISAEPLLGPVTLNSDWLAPAAIACWKPGHRPDSRDSAALAEITRAATRMLATDRGESPPAYLDWVVVGGESGPGARPMHPDWARSLRDQCVGAGVPFLFKQWGEHVTVDQMPEDTFRGWDSEHGTSNYGRDMQWRVGKKAAGRELDERTWDEYPTARMEVSGE